MHAQDLTLQRYLDGELKSAEAQAVKAMLDNKPSLRETYEQEHAFDELLYDVSNYTSDDEQHLAIANIMGALPSSAPARKATFSIAQIACASVLIILIACTYGLAGNSDISSIIPMSVITFGSLIIGSLLIFMARPLRRMRASITARLLDQRFNIGQADVLVYRCAGLAIILGGAYLMF